MATCSEVTTQGRSGTRGASSYADLGGFGAVATLPVMDASAGMGAETGSVPDRDQVLMEHLPTVRYLARRIHERLPQHVELDDLISAGVVGWMDAFSKFDHNKKVQLKR